MLTKIKPSTNRFWLDTCTHKTNPLTVEGVRIGKLWLYLFKLSLCLCNQFAATTPRPSACRPNEFTCRSRDQCVPYSAVCNGKNINCLKIIMLPSTNPISSIMFVRKIKKKEWIKLYYANKTKPCVVFSYILISDVSQTMSGRLELKYDNISSAYNNHTKIV